MSIMLFKSIIYNQKPHTLYEKIQFTTHKYPTKCAINGFYLTSHTNTIKFNLFLNQTTLCIIKNNFHISMFFQNKPKFKLLLKKYLCQKLDH